MAALWAEAKLLGLSSVWKEAKLDFSSLLGLCGCSLLPTIWPVGP